MRERSTILALPDHKRIGSDAVEERRRLGEAQAEEFVNFWFESTRTQLRTRHHDDEHAGGHSAFKLGVPYSSYVVGLIP